MGRIKDYSQFFTGLDLKPAVLLPNFNVKISPLKPFIDSVSDKSVIDGGSHYGLFLDLE